MRFHTIKNEVDSQDLQPRGAGAASPGERGGAPAAWERIRRLPDITLHLQRNVRDLRSLQANKQVLRPL